VLDPPDESHHLAKVRVAGSNPVFRSNWANKVPGQSGFVKLLAAMARANGAASLRRSLSKARAYESSVVNHYPTAWLVLHGLDGCPNFAGGHISSLPWLVRGTRSIAEKVDPQIGDSTH
jgi:hypothetical protein